jgi:hypothetical protein
MRDFHNEGQINVHGDFNVTDNSRNEHKLLAHCSSEELLHERPFRQGNIQLEQARKVRRLKPYYAISLALFLLAAAWATFVGKADLASLVLGGVSLVVAYASLKATVESNGFQIEEQAAVAEINKILKQRRVE